jgi:hypothetical protein
MLFRPRDSFDQRLLDCQLLINPKPVEIRWIHDVFGNCLTLVDFNILAEVLEFETTIRLELLQRTLQTFGSRNTLGSTRSRMTAMNYRIWSRASVVIIQAMQPSTNGFPSLLRPASTALPGGYS